MNFETCPEIESVIARYFDSRRCVIVSNVWWGLGLNHECDLFVLTKSCWAYEVEIKISKSDLKADLKKKFGHVSSLIRKLYFAIPGKLEPCIDLIPARAGILVVGSKGDIFKLREAEVNPHARKLTETESLKLAHLGTMRIWKLKAAFIRLAKMKNIPLQEVLPLTEPDHA